MLKAVNSPLNLLSIYSQGFANEGGPRQDPPEEPLRHLHRPGGRAARARPAGLDAAAQHGLWAEPGRVPVHGRAGAGGQPGPVGGQREAAGAAGPARPPGQDAAGATAPAAV